MYQKIKHATLSEVAEEAGVGTTTVSRVINGGLSVNPKTRARVQAAIERLGYMPNQAARILKGDRTRTIGLVIPSIADPFFASCAEAVQSVVRTHDSVLTVLTTQNEEQAELEAIHLLIRRRIEGIILAPANSEHNALRELVCRVHMPIVALDRPISGSTVPHVLVDNMRGAQLATQHLIDHGYRRILCLTGETGFFTIRERIRGYQAAMHEAGLQATVDTSIHNHQSSEQMFSSLFGNGRLPDAIFTLKNSTTIDTFETLHKHAIPIPETVALLGYDDFPLAGMVRPSISVVRQPVEELGHRAAEMLFTRLTASHELDRKTPSLQLTTTLIRRASCGCEPM